MQDPRLYPRQIRLMFGLAPVAAVPSMYSPLRYLTPVATEVREEQEW